MSVTGFEKENRSIKEVLVLSSPMSVAVRQGIPVHAGDTNTGSGSYYKNSSSPTATFSMAPNVPRVIFNLSG